MNEFTEIITNKIEPIEERFIRVDGIQSEQISNNDYLIEKINEIIDFINKQ